MLFFICVQFLFIECSKNFSIETSTMVTVYLCFFYTSLAICLTTYLIFQYNYYSIKMFFVNIDGYTNKIWKDKDIILKK